MTFEELVVLARSGGLNVLKGLKPKSALTSYRISKSVSNIMIALREYEDAAKAKIAELGTTDEKGVATIKREDKEAIAAFREWEAEFLELKPEDMKLYPVKISEIRDQQVPVSVFLNAPELFIDDIDYIESLADYAHTTWSGWMKYLFEKSTENEDGTVTIPKELVERWKRQMSTPYSELPEEEKKSDGDEAQKILDIVFKA